MPVKRLGWKTQTVALTATGSSYKDGTITLDRASVIHDIMATSHNNADFTLKVELKGGEPLINGAHRDQVDPANAGRIRIPSPGLVVNPTDIEIRVTNLSGSSNVVYVTVGYIPVEGNPQELNVLW